MRAPPLLILTAALSPVVGCDAGDVNLNPRVDPISAPIAGDLERRPDAEGCALPTAEEEWLYTWDGDRLQTAAFRNAVTALAVDEHAFEYGDAGLTRWTRGNAAFPIETSFERDPETGQITEWIHRQGATPLTVTITREDGALELHLAGQMFLGFEAPLLVDLDRIDPDLPALVPRLDLILPHLERLAEAQDDEAVWEVLDAFDATQRVEQTADGEATILDVDGDGAPDIIERITRVGEATTTTVDFALDAQIDITIDATPGRSERTSTGLDGEVSRVITQVDATHVFIDQLDDEGAIKARSSLFFNADGARVLKYEDDNADGQPNWRKRYINDAVSGFRIFDETDSDADGSIDMRREYDRDADGRVLRATLFRINTGDCADTW